MNELGLTQHCLDITRPESQNILDLVLTNKPAKVIDVKSLPGMSDHNIVMATFKMSTSCTRLPQRTIYKFDKADWDAIKLKTDELANNYFRRNPDSKTVNENCDFIERGICDLIKSNIPSKRSRSKESFPWISQEIKRHQRKRDKLYISACKSRSPEKWHKFREQRQKVKNLIRESHLAHVTKNIGESLRENPKPFWSYVKSLRQDKQTIPILQSKTGLLVANDRAKADTLNEQFTSVFTKEDLSSIPTPHHQYPRMPHITFGTERISKLLSNIKPGKAGGPDQIPARFLKETSQQLAKIY